MPRMTKADIIEAVYEKVGGFSKKEAAEIVEMVFDTIKQTLERGEKIKPVGINGVHAEEVSAIIDFDANLVRAQQLLRLRRFPEAEQVLGAHLVDRPDDALVQGSAEIIDWCDAHGAEPARTLTPAPLAGLTTTVMSASPARQLSATASHWAQYCLPCSQDAGAPVAALMPVFIRPSAGRADAMNDILGPRRQANSATAGVKEGPPQTRPARKMSQEIGSEASAQLSTEGHEIEIQNSIERAGWLGGDVPDPRERA